MSEKRKEFLRAVKFVLFSISAGLIQIGSFAVLHLLLPEHYEICHIISLALSVLWNFTLNRRFTFQSAANVPVAMLKVLAFYLVFTPLSTWLGGYLVNDLKWNEFLVEIINMLLNFVLEFLYQRFFVFNKNLDDRKK